jgi:predicted ATPase/class 3 adenylate cyclase
MPSGTVTLLFSDIQGSTKLLQELGEPDYHQVLAEHRRILRTAFERRGGYEVGTQGDGFFVAFANADDAVGAAIDAQRGLETHRWPHDRPVRVRIGIHTGEPAIVGPDYTGLDVHRAARISSSAHGGQIVLSAATRALLSGAASNGFELRDLGEHRLKDLGRPERLFQVVVEGLIADFPSLRSLQAAANLPVMLTSLVGREKELNEIVALLRDGARLLTLTGPGGTGKTRIAVRLAEELRNEFRDGAFFVALASVTNPALVGSTIARAVGAEESGSATPLDAVEELLAGKSLLVVLDNFEQVLEAAHTVPRLLAVSSELRVVVTSRAILRVTGEVEYPVPPLSLPAPTPTGVEAYLRSEAVNLFVDRARTVNREFALTEENAGPIAEICRRLDGLPLAIELAAARTRVLSPEALLYRLDRHLGLLTGGPRDAPARQRTLRGAIDWSYELLASAEKVLFRRLSVFVGGWSLESAEAVVGSSLDEDVDLLDVLSSLLDKNLLRSEQSYEGKTRFSMLQTIRDYALERLSQDSDAVTLQRRHARHFLELGETTEPELLGPDQADRLAKLEDEHDNLRSALSFSLGDDALKADHVGIRLAGALGRFWYTRGHLAEGSRWLEASLKLHDSAPLEHRAKSLHMLGVLYAERGLHERSIETLQKGLELHRLAGNPERVAASLNSLGVEAYALADYDHAKELFEESISIRRDLGDERGTSSALSNLGLLAMRHNDFESAISLFEEAIEIDRRHGNEWGIAIGLSNLSAAVLDTGDVTRAELLVREAVPILRRIGERDTLADCLERGVAIASVREQWTRAARLAGAAAALREDIGSPLIESDRAKHDANIELSRSALGEHEFDAAADEGRRLADHEAIAYLMADDDSLS